SAAWCLRHGLPGRLPRDVGELPLVVRRRAVGLAERMRLALAPDAPNQLSKAARRLLHAWRSLWPRSGHVRRLYAGRIRLAGVHADEVEVVVGDRVLEFLAEETALDEGVDVGRAGRGVLLPKELNRAVVLLPAEHQLLFLLPHRQRVPDGQQHRH